MAKPRTVLNGMPQRMFFGAGGKPYSGCRRISIPGGLKNAIDWVSRLPNQPFAGKPIALQSAANDILGGGRMQYDLRRCMTFLDALTMNKPEIFIGNCSQRIDDKTGQIKDEQTIGFIKQQLRAFAKFIEQHGGKS